VREPLRNEGAMKRILIIDDDECIRRYMTAVLKPEGYETFTAANGALGLEAARGIHPDLIICDVEMPVLDGYGMLDEIRKDPLTASIPFIFLTAMLDREHMRHGMERGADDYVTKPCSREELIRAVKAQETKQTANQRKLQEKLDELRRSITLSLPHELRTPLTGIIGASALLRDDPESFSHKEIKDLADIIFASGHRLNRLIENYLIYAEISTAFRTPEALERLRKSRIMLHGEQSIPLKEQIEDIALDEAAKCQRSDDLEMDLEEGYCRIPSPDLRKIIEELVNNAFKFSRHGSKVTVSGACREGSYLLSITDRGRGMARKQITELGAFIQIDRKSQEQQGSGLGIAIAMSLLGLYEGVLELDSIPGSYTAAKVELPSRLKVESSENQELPGGRK
jgi:two-component system, sensor histidine kinase and response regulator